MKRLFILCALLGIALPATAAPKWLTAVPRSVGRTTKDFVTWKYPLVNIAFLCEVGADLADAKTTEGFVARGGFEQHAWLYGQQPHFSRVAAIDLGSSFALFTYDHWMNEYADKQGLSKWDWERNMTPLPQAIDASLTGYAAWQNASVK